MGYFPGTVWEWPGLSNAPCAWLGLLLLRAMSVSTHALYSLACSVALPSTLWSLPRVVGQVLILQTKWLHELLSWVRPEHCSYMIFGLDAFLFLSLVLRDTFQRVIVSISSSISMCGCLAAMPELFQKKIFVG